ncbi:response regulator [Bradyrhizobium japonicum]|uniref:response regulator n=1 Tax=Bradyrhizobium japonicum TaxID=375 RepID=UPI001BA94E49|nr:response regulator [Bradyrhizobium japonicum]MBR0995497.1 response regulator [Bradyrhizobium japonicum]
MRIDVPRRGIVLVVEDEVLVRMLTVGTVEDAGYEVIEARHADEAVAILEARSDIALVVTDVDMPGSMDGLKLAHAVRNRWPPIKLVVVSGKSNLTEADLPSDTRFFAKPYSVGALVSALSSLLAHEQ